MNTEKLIHRHKYLEAKNDPTTLAGKPIKDGVKTYFCIGAGHCDKPVKITVHCINGTKNMMKQNRIADMPATYLTFSHPDK